MPFQDADQRKQYHRNYDASRRKTHRATKVTIPLQDYRFFEDLAKKEQITVSKLLVSLAQAKAYETPFLSTEMKGMISDITRLLRSSANSVNQVAHACNLNHVTTPEEGVEILTQIHEGLVQVEAMVKERLS